MAIILKANKVNLFVSSVLFVFWYHSPNVLDTPRNTMNGIAELPAVRVAERDSCPGGILPTHCVMTALQKHNTSAIVAELVVKPRGLTAN
jgi:hypothetical protein